MQQTAGSHTHSSMHLRREQCVDVGVTVPTLITYLFVFLCMCACLFQFMCRCSQRPESLGSYGTKVVDVL